MKKRNVSSITVTFNPDIEILINQIRQLENQVEHILIVDNCSDNVHHIEDIISNFNKVNLFKLSDNYGIAYAQNVGIKAAKKANSDHVVLFDQDSLINDDFIDGLIKSEQDLLMQGKKVGAVGPCFIDQNTGHRYKNTYIRNIPILKGLLLAKEEFTENTVILESYFLIASGCFIRMEILDKIGMMDEKLFIDNVDVEWCFRAQFYGYKVYTTSLSTMIHNIGEGKVKVFGKLVSIHSNVRKYYNTRNNLQLLRCKYIRLGTKLRIVPFLTAKFFIGIKDTSNIKEYIKFHCYAINDFIKNKNGKLILKKK